MFLVYYVMKWLLFFTCKSQVSNNLQIGGQFTLFTAMETQLTINDLPRVTQELLPLAERWKSIGRALQLDMTRFEDEMQQQKFHGRVTNWTTDDYLSEMLREWLNRVFPKPTWSSIIHVLRRSTIGGKTLAMHLESKYCIAAPLQLQLGDSGESLLCTFRLH